MDAEKEIIEMADRIGQFYNYQITQSDTCELAKFLHNAGCRKQSDTVKEFAEKLLSPLINGYNQSYKASGYDMEAAISASEIKHYIDYIKQSATQYGVEEETL